MGDISVTFIFFPQSHNLHTDANTVYKKKPTQKELKMLPSDKTVNIKHFLFQGEHFEENVAFVKIKLQQKILCNAQNSNCYLYSITEHVVITKMTCSTNRLLQKITIDHSGVRRQPCSLCRCH